MGLESLFPETIFVADYVQKYGLNKAITKQLNVVNGELLECQDALSRNDYSHLAEEIVDVLHSAMQVVYMIHNGQELVKQKIDEVHKKNKEGNYYK